MQYYNGPGNSEDTATSLAVDATGNVYVTGKSTGSGSLFDYATIKYSDEGDELWVARYNGPANQDDTATQVIVDAAGNIYVTGGSKGSGSNFDFATIKYSPDGSELWTARYNGPANKIDQAVGLALDSAGNVIVVGSSEVVAAKSDYVTLKYTTDGDPLWVARYNGPALDDDRAFALALDPAGDIYVTGTSKTSSTGYDIVTVKYNTTDGSEAWVSGFNSSGTVNDTGVAVGVDSQFNVYVGGQGYSKLDYTLFKYQSGPYAPAIVTQPENRYVLLGQNAPLSVRAGGTGSLKYQWKFKGAVISGATNATYLRTNVQSTTLGAYTVVVTNTLGSVTSSVANLLLGVRPTFTAQPQNQIVILGDTATFTSSVNATPAAKYRWQFNGARIVGPTNSFLTIPNAQTNDAGNYALIVTNVLGATTSVVATLTVNVPPGISAQPAPLTIVQGQSASFSVTATGTTPFRYQWLLNGVPVTGATNAVLSINPARTNHAGGYTVIVTNVAGTVISSNAILTVYVPPEISNQPQNLAVVQGQAANFSVDATGIPAPQYQWRFNGVNLTGATNAVYVRTNAQTNHAGGYSVVLTNVAGSLTSSVANLIVNVPAGIATQPVNRVITQGQNTSFSVVASGTAPFNYQWWFNGSPLAGATDPTLAINAGRTNNAGSYTVLVSNPYGSSTSVVATLTVNVPPEISNQPQDLAVVQGQAANFSVDATGIPAPQYQWRFNGVNLTGATNAVYVRTNAQTNHAGGYSVVMTNVAGAITSSVATLIVNVPAGIATQPVSRSITQGQNTSFFVVPSGTGPFWYQWYFNGSALPGETDTLLALLAVQTNLTGNYTVVVTNLYGSITSAVATLTVNVPPEITDQPQDQTVLQGENASFSVSATGLPAPRYQWRLNGANVTGATNAVLLRNNAQASQAGNYTVVVTNVAGMVTSAVAVLVVNVPATIATQPANKTVIQGQNATFNVVAAGTPPFFYQWYYFGAPINGETASSLTIPFAQTNDAGGYFVVVTNNFGFAISAVATLTVNVPPEITEQPQAQTVVQGENAFFSVSATGLPDPRYQWRFNGATITGATNSVFTRTSAQASQAGNYTVVVTNVAGAITSAPAVLVVNVPAGIATQPSNQTVTQGANAAFSVIASGTGPFWYQWYFNGAPVPGAIATNLTIIAAQTNHAGTYNVVVTNLYGSATSSVVSLTVNVPPVISDQPQSTAVVLGDNATFTVAATGLPVPRYQWRFNGVNLTGATNTVYTRTNAQTSHAGSYTVAVTNVAGAITSAVATLTVNVPASIATQPVSQIGTQGLATAFSVVASGTAPFGYQWKFNGLDLAGATNSTLSLTSLKFLQAGTYNVQVSNPWGSALSVPAFLTVLPPTNDRPVMDQLVVHLPFDGTLNDASGRNNHAAAVRNPNLVQGFIGNGAFNPYTQNGLGHYATLGTNSDLAFGRFTDFTIAFWARVPANGWGGSNTFQDPVFISNKDWSSGDNTGWVVATGDDARVQWNFSESGGNPRRDYDGPGGTFGNPVWRHIAVTFSRGGDAITYLDGMPVDTTSIAPPPLGSTKSIDTALPINIGNDGTGSYLLGFWTNALANPTNGLNLDDLGIWRRVVTPQEIAAIYNVGLIGQNLASVSSNDLTSLTRPRITQAPADVLMASGGNATFSVVATGSPTLRYQWYGNGSLLAGRTNTSFTLTNVTSAPVSNYWVVVTNSLAKVTSSVATLTLTVPPTISTQPASQSVTLGQNVSFSVVGSGAPAPAYQWRFNGTPLSGATSSTFSRTNVQTTHAGSYTVVLTNVVGAITSSVAVLTVNVPPAITTSPVNQIVGQGQNATFSSAASGTAPLAYQWFFNGAPLSGASNSNLVLTAVQTNKSGSYSVRVTNVAGVVTSAVATLTVVPSPTVLAQPSSQSVAVGEVANFSVTATGSPDYQWRFNGVNLPGETNATFSRTNVRPVHAGGYSVVLTNLGGSVTSSVATLTTTVPAGVPSTVWLATKGPTTVTGGTPVSWTTNHVVAFDGPNLTYGANATFGTFRVMFGFQPPQPIRALYFVTTTNRVGNPGFDVELKPGDLLVVFNISTATTIGGVPNVLRDDVLLYRPGPFRDYSSGTFSMLLDNPINDGGVRNIHALTLVESDTYVGGTLVPKGTFLVARSDATKHMNVYTYRPTSVGPGDDFGGRGQFVIEREQTRLDEPGAGAGFDLDADAAGRDRSGAGLPGDKSGWGGDN